MRFVIHFLLFFVFLSSQRQRLYLLFCLFLALSSGGSALSVPLSLFHFRIYVMKTRSASRHGI